MEPQVSVVERIGSLTGSNINVCPFQGRFYWCSLPRDPLILFAAPWALMFVAFGDGQLFQSPPR
jgi:hypothetical protein